MYLSRVEVDTNNRRKIKELTHLGAYHDWVEQCFPQEFEKEERTRKLWRIDKLNGRIYLLIVSQTVPDIDRLERYGVAGSGSCKDYQPFLDSLKEGERYNFRVVLNPVKSVPDGNKGSGRRGRVYPLLAVEKQAAFLKERSEKNGFRLDDDEYRIVERGFKLTRREPSDGQKRKTLRISQAAYEGRLVITDIEKFKKVLSEGMGREKAFGCGMMTVIPEAGH